MIVFDDYEPEDAWDAADGPAEQLDNLRRRVLLLYSAQSQPRVETLAEIALAVVCARAREHHEPRDSTRIADLFDDIAFLAGRS